MAFVAGFFQAVERAAGNDFAAVAQKFAQDLFQIKQARLAVHQRHHIDAEAVLQLGEFVELVQYHFGVFVAFQLDHHAHTGFVRFVAQFADAFQYFIAHQLADFFHQLGFVYLIGDFIDDNRFALAVFADGLDMGFRPHHYAAAAAAVAFAHAGQAVDGGAGGEVGGFDDVDQLINIGIRFGQQFQAGINRIIQIVRRNIGGHAHRDAFGAVYQQRGDARRQNQRLAFTAVVVGAEINRFFFDVRQHFVGDFRHADFGVTHRRRIVAVHRAEVALPVDKHIAQGKGLRHAHDGHIHRRIAVRVVFTDHIADHAGGLFIGAVPVVFQLVHSVEHAAVHGFETVAHIGQRAPHNHAHRVIEIGLAHFVF